MVSAPRLLSADSCFSFVVFHFPTANPWLILTPPPIRLQPLGRHFPGAWERGRDAGVLGHLATPLGLGLLRLATEGRPDRTTAIHLIAFAVQCGIRLLDTAGVYHMTVDGDENYGERLAVDALQAAGVDDVRLLTKVGLVRRGNRWIPHGRPAQIRHAVEASLAALQRDRIDYLLLHARDPQTPLEDTLGELAELQRQGLVWRLGLCNTTVPEIQQAQRHFDVTLVQNELSVLRRQHASSGLLQWTRDAGIPFLAYRPLGGKVKPRLSVDGIDGTEGANRAKPHRYARDKVLSTLAERHQATPHQVALAALLDTSPHVIPLIGATRVESVMSSIAALGVPLDVSDRTALAIKHSFEPDGDWTATMPLASAATAADTEAPAQSPGCEPEVVILMGIQGAGKSELVGQYVDAGYARLNRDELGGTLDSLVPRLLELLQAGRRQVVLDNTYPTRTSRAGVIAAAQRFGLPVRCRFLNTPLAEAQRNIVQRMVARYGLPLGPEEMKSLRKKDPNLPPPQALVRWLNSFEPPNRDEGFRVVEELPFQRRPSPHHIQKGLLLDVDGTLRTTLSGDFYPRHPDDQQLLPGRSERLREWVDDGYQLFFVSNQGGVATGRLPLAAMQACFLRTVQLLELPVVEVAYCPHPSHPIGCFCRKPLPGLGVYLIERHRLSADHLVMVGDLDTDRAFADNISATYYHESDFFA